MAQLQTFVEQPELKFGYDAISADQDLARQIQIRLIALNLLDGPADGKFGPISTAALEEFQKRADCGDEAKFEYIGAITARKLIQTKALPSAPLTLGNDLASCIIKYMQTRKNPDGSPYTIATGPKNYNIVYVEGMGPDGKLNKDEPNCFNDARLVIEIPDGTPKLVGSWEATTEPGSKYTQHPLSPKGAARIAFGQYRAWSVGIHKDHEALVQTAPITVYRDFNKDFSRAGDATDTGLFGVNQHWGYDLPYNDVQGASAGCLVGRMKQGHREFMALIKQDKRYQANNAYLFVTTVMPGDELFKHFPPA